MDPKAVRGYREKICATCPGTVWGQKSICRVHAMSIGQVESCPEWSKKEDGAPGDPPQGQTLLLDLEPAMESVQKVEDELRNYPWMVGEIHRLETYLNETIYVDSGSDRVTALYGLEASMPKAQGKKIGELSISEKQYNRTIKRINELKKRVDLIDQAAEKVRGEMQRTALDCFLAGERMNDIAFHLHISRQRLNEIRHSIVRQMTFELYKDEIAANSGLHF